MGTRNCDPGFLYPLQGALRCKLADVKAERDCLASDLGITRRRMAAMEDAASQPGCNPPSAGAPLAPRPASMMGMGYPSPSPTLIPALALALSPPIALGINLTRTRTLTPIKTLTLRHRRLRQRSRCTHAPCTASRGRQWRRTAAQSRHPCVRPPTRQ